ncbi:hypothetical protein PT974_04760 [Cladobotryum mycophilum]|uniref:Uncharacterized protein n=1 Tax=Cladobotryum mycophilum TaxID=491253 RepID=A0ABR0SQ31_9HYPO
MCTYGSISTLVIGLALIALREPLRQRPVGRICRLTLFSLLVAFLIVSLVPTSVFIQDPLLASCAWKILTSKGGLDKATLNLISSALLDIFFNASTFVMTVTDVSPWVSDLVFVKGKEALRFMTDKLSRLESAKGKWWNYRQLTSTLHLSGLYMDLYKSPAAKPCWMAVGLIWTGFRLRLERQNDIPGGDKIWGFSQVIAMFSLMIPSTVVVVKIKSSQLRPEDSISDNGVPNSSPAQSSEFGPVPLPVHLMPESQDTSGETVLMRVDNDSQTTSSWKLWVTVLIVLYNLAAIAQVLCRGSFHSGFDGLGVVTPRVELQIREKTIIMRVFNPVWFAASVAWGFFSCAGTLIVLPLSTRNWSQEHGLGSVFPVGEDGSARLTVKVPHGILILSCIPLGIMILGQIIRCIVCSKGFQRWKARTLAPENADVELAALPQRHTASGPKLQFLRDALNIVRNRPLMSFSCDDSNAYFRPPNIVNPLYALYYSYDLDINVHHTTLSDLLDGTENVIANETIKGRCDQHQYQHQCPQAQGRRFKSRQKQLKKFYSVSPPTVTLKPMVRLNAQRALKTSLRDEFIQDYQIYTFHKLNWKSLVWAGWAAGTPSSRSALAIGHDLASIPHQRPNGSHI